MACPAACWPRAAVRIVVNFTNLGRRQRTGGRRVEGEGQRAPR